jgi:serine protease Do
MTPTRLLRLSAVFAAFSALPYVAPFARASEVTEPPSSQLYLVTATPGYLGVTVRDLDEARAQKLKLKQPAGAEVISLDRDAPASKSGMRRGDVIESINGQTITDAETLRRVMHDMPIGKTVTVAFVRGGKPMAVHVQLADRELLAQQAWANHFSVPQPDRIPTISGFVSGGSHIYMPSPEETTPYVGAEVEPFGSQLAKFFGVKAGSGLLVKRVEDKSPATAAGLQAGDIILSANGTPLASRGEWLEVLRNNPRRPVALSVVRNHHPLNLSITVDPQKTESELRGATQGALADIQPLLQQMRDGKIGLTDDDLKNMKQQLAESQAQIAQLDTSAMTQALEEARRQAGNIDPSAIRKQMEDAREQMKSQVQTIEPTVRKQMEEAREQLQSALQSIDTAALGKQIADSIDTEAIRKQVEEAQKQINSIDTDAIRKQMEDVQKQLREQMKLLHPDGSPDGYTF